ncbi:hypothetical protein [Streptomyces sp. YIM B13518]|uniref:hypothetical protein n=1 Tax=Streptomyces sp. YIM B13518 TaxID=3366316 RepID=UPI0036B988EF
MKATTANGVTAVGIRDTQPNVTPFIFYDLTADPSYPENACAVSVASQANLVSVQVITTDGDLYETQCDIVPGTPDTLDCDGVWNPTATA